MTREEMMKDVERAGVSVAASAITNPGIYPAYTDWVAAKAYLSHAKKNLAEASAKWYKTIEPALNDKDYMSIAIKKDLLPKEVRYVINGY